MFIDAKVDSVILNEDGTATLNLVSRDGKTDPGREQLTVVNPPPDIPYLAGFDILGDPNGVACCNTKIGNLDGGTTLYWVGPGGKGDEQVAVSSAEGDAAEG